MGTAKQLYGVFTKLWKEKKKENSFGNFIKIFVKVENTILHPIIINNDNYISLFQNNCVATMRVQIDECIFA